MSLRCQSRIQIIGVRGLHSLQVDGTELFR